MKEEKERAAAFGAIYSVVPLPLSLSIAAARPPARFAQLLRLCIAVPLLFAGPFSRSPFR